MSKSDLLSVIIPAYNEEANIVETINQVVSGLQVAVINYELVIVNDNSKDSTPQLVSDLAKDNDRIKLVNRQQPGGFGRAIRTGLSNFTGDYVVIVMADLSDSVEDIVSYYRTLQQGYDSVFGSRFMKGSSVTEYPPIKLLVNRLVNKFLQLFFFTKHNDLTNAFKAYRAEVIRDILPLQAAHFNITIELSLSVLIRKYKIAKVPISWTGRKWGSSNLRLTVMGRRYLATLLKIWFERLLILDDINAEKSIQKPEDQ